MDLPDVVDRPLSSRDNVDRLVDRFAAGLLAYVRRVTGSWHDAEDVVQAALLKATVAMRAGESPASEKAWVFTLARNEMLNHLGKRGTARRALTRLVRNDSESDRGLRLPECFDALHQEVAQLPPAAREAVALRYFHGLTTEETAEVLGVSAGTVKQHLFRALRTLRLRLGAGPLEDRP